MTYPKDFKCAIHYNCMEEDFFASHRQLFPLAYLEAKPMAELAIALAKSNRSKPCFPAKIVMLPFDCMAEAEALGAKVYGYEDSFGLRGGEKPFSKLDQLLALSPLAVTGGRLGEILQAITILRGKGLVPCLNLGGLFSIGDSLLSAEKLYLSWLNPQEKPRLLQFFKALTTGLVAYAGLAAEAGAQIISLSDPLASINLVGPKMGAEVGRLLQVPLLKSLEARLLQCNQPMVIHVCGVTATALNTLPEVEVVSRCLSAKIAYPEAVAAVLAEAGGVTLLAYGCLNRQQTVDKLYQLNLKESGLAAGLQ